MPYTEPPPPFPAQNVVLVNPDGTQTAAYREWLSKFYAWLARFAAST